MADTVMFLGGVALPKYLSLKRRQPVNESTNQTLDGTIYTDFFNRRREWVIDYPLLTVAEYTTIQNLFERQYTNGTFLEFQFSAQSIYCMVKLEINDQNIRHGAQYYEGVSITLREQNAIS